MENNVLKIIEESGSKGPKYESLVKIFKLYEQLQYATNIKHIAHDIYYWLNREFRIDNMVFTLFNINKNEKEDIYIEGEHFYLDDEFSNFFIINTDTSINATVSFRAISKVHNKIIQDQFYIIDAAFHLISPIIQNGILKKNYIESSSIDSVTNVYNRSYLVEHLNKHLSLTRNKQSQIYFLMVGIDHFKAVIDEFNHDIGDIVLIELAKVIHSNISEFDMVGRLTGDEFLISLFSVEYEYEVNSIAHKIIADFAQTEIIVDEKTNQILKKTICIGIDKHLICDEKDINETIKNADIALYEAKNKGRSSLFNYKDLRIEDTIDLF
jgi:diguanylate cyclase (GGDEF)-like protein